MVSSPSYNPNDVEQNFGRIEKIRADCKPASPLLNRATPGSLPAGLDLQGRDRVGRARVSQVHALLDLRRPRLLHRLRQAREQLRHRAAVRHGLARDRAPVLGQLGVLQHRARARRQADRQAGQEVRLLRAPSARDARERAACERPLPQGEPLRPEARPRRRRRPDGVRPGAAARDAAADGDGGGDDRQRRHPDAPVRGREDPHARAARPAPARSRPRSAGPSRRRPRAT